MNSPASPSPPDFHTFAAAGARLMDLHINYEKQPEYPLGHIEHPTNEVTFRVTRMKLSKDRSELRYNDFLTLRGIPLAAFDYRLGNRSALEWVIDQYQVSTDKRSGIVNDPNREDDPKYILRLITQVITVSLETQQIIAALLTSGAPWGADLHNHRIPTLAPPGTRAVVLFFLATDCPISDRYQPTITRLAHQFAQAHIAMYTVYPNPTETAPGIQAHQTAFAQTLPALRDPNQSLVHLTGARTTPEAAILLPTASGLRLAYLGRIDDRYITLGTQRPTPTHNDLAEALQAALSNQPIPQPTGPPVGCSIMPLKR